MSHFGLTAAAKHEDQLNAATVRLNEAASRTRYSAIEWMNLAAELAESGILLNQLRFVAGVSRDRQRYGPAKPDVTIWPLTIQRATELSTQRKARPND